MFLSQDIPPLHLFILSPARAAQLDATMGCGSSQLVAHASNASPEQAPIPEKAPKLQENVSKATVPVASSPPQAPMPPLPPAAAPLPPASTTSIHAHHVARNVANAPTNEDRPTVIAARVASNAVAAVVAANSFTTAPGNVPDSDSDRPTVVAARVASSAVAAVIAANQ